MTSKPIFTKRALIALAIPIILDALLAIAAGVVDTVMVSAAGEAAVAAVSNVDSLNIMFIMIFNAIATGGVVVCSQYIGAGDINNAKKSANQLLYGSTICATVIAAILLCIIPQVINLVYPNLAPDVFQDSKDYFFWTILSYPFFAMGASSMALLRAQAKSNVALIISLFANLSNVIANAILIYGFDMGAEGAAIGTAFSRVVFTVAGIVILKNPHLPVHFEKLLKFKLDFAMLKRILKIGVPNGIENGLFQLGKILVASLIASFGTIANAAYSVAYTLNNIGWVIIGAFGTVLLTVVGQCMGAGEREQARRYTKNIINFSYILVIVMFGIIFLLRNYLVLMFDFEAEAIKQCAYYTGVASVFAICSVYSWAFLPLAAFRAAGDTKFALFSSVSFMFIFRVALAYLLAYFFDLGLMSVWIAMATDWIARVILNITRFRSNKWMTKKVI